MTKLLLAATLALFHRGPVLEAQPGEIEAQPRRA